MKPPFLVPFVLLAFIAVTSLAANAAELNGVSMPDTLSVAGKTLQLNGLGLRSATFLNIKVYVAGLYLPAKSRDAAAILASKEPRALRMQFLRDVEARKINIAWADSFEGCGPKCDAVQPQLKTLKSSMVDMKKGDSLEYLFLSDRVELTVRGKKLSPILGSDFSEVLLSTWLGSKPPTEELKEGLLGPKQN